MKWMELPLPFLSYILHINWSSLLQTKILVKLNSSYSYTQLRRRAYQLLINAINWRSLWFVLCNTHQSYPWQWQSGPKKQHDYLLKSRWTKYWSWQVKGQVSCWACDMKRSGATWLKQLMEKLEWTNMRLHSCLGHAITCPFIEPTVEEFTRPMRPHRFILCGYIIYFRSQIFQISHNLLFYLKLYFVISFVIFRV